MTIVKTTGGARIGSANATWPFAILTVDESKLELNAFLIGNLVFRPSDIISISSYSSFSNSGLKINHKVSEYKQDVVFWTREDPNFLINQIKQTGFCENKKRPLTLADQDILDKQRAGSSPIRKTAAIAFGVLWNVLFLYDIVNFFVTGQKKMILNTGAIVALSTVLIGSVSILVSKEIREIILKPGRTVSDVDRFLYFLMFIALFMLTVIIIVNNVT